MATEILYSHFSNILRYIEDNLDETDSTYHIYTLISDYFYNLDSDLWKLFKPIKFDINFLHFDLQYNEEDLDIEGENKDDIVCEIVYSILKDTAYSSIVDNAYMPIEEEYE